MTVPILRVARPGGDFGALLHFYCKGLGMVLLDCFQSHNGFDGVILGQKGAPYHLEITKKHGSSANRAPSPDNLLVFYLENHEAWHAAEKRMKSVGFTPVASFNPYWDQRGVTFEDPDGYRIVLHNSRWTPG